MLKPSCSLKFIQTLSAGIDHLLSNPIVKETRIPITNSSGVHGPPIAEWTVMNWLVASRKYISIYEAQQRHQWDGFRNMYGIHDQVGARVGILGYGAIGRQIGRVASALGATVYAYTASPRSTPASRKDPGYVVPGTGDPDGTIPISWHHGLGKEALHSFLSIGLDHLVISLPLTSETTHLLSAQEFEILANASSSSSSVPSVKNTIRKPYLTNISRGKVVDQTALVEALHSGLLGGAAVDVTDPEPLPPGNPAWDAPNLQISPHLSSLGVEYLERVFDIVRVNLDRHRKGEPLINEYKRGRSY